MSPAIASVPHQQLRCTVPASGYIVRVLLTWLCHDPSKAKVTQLHYTVPTNKDVLRLDVTVQDLIQEYIQVEVRVRLMDTTV